MTSSAQRRRAAPGFLRTWSQLLGPLGVPSVGRRRGRTPRVPLSELLPALIFHVMQGPGTLAEHAAQLFEDTLVDSSWADRRARLPWAIFTELMQRMLRPRATRRQPGAFWRGWRVVALDGTQFSLTNTPQVVGATTKARTRRGRAAFAKLTTTVLLEVGVHNPLAAGIGRQGESEWALALRLLTQVPPRSLLLADQLYGVAAFVGHARAACARVGSHFVLRARRGTKPRLVTRLSDGTRIVALAVRAPHTPTRILEWLEVREIRVQVGRRGHRTHEVRLWTSLLDPQTAPALELAQVYTQRWEHELYFREIKRQLRTTDVLQSHTVETGAQEIAAIVLASAVLAAERLRAAGALPALRISFPKLLDVVTAVWQWVDLGDGILTTPQLDRILKRGYARMRQCLTPERRARTNPRAVRQPTQAWPRLMHTQSVQGPWDYQLV